MKLPVWAWIAAIVARELLRALAFPVHLALYWPQRHRWAARARRALAADPPADRAAGLEALFARRRRRTGAPPHVFVSAGEPSGEAHAAAVLTAARNAGLAARWSCFGGPVLQRAGAELRFPLSEHAIMGLSGVLRSLPFLVRALGRYLKLLRADPPDLVVLVDYPGLHVIMGRLARRHAVPVVHYIAPQYWAWAPWRLERYRRAMDATLTIFPFEPAFFASVGLSAAYAGHPLLDRAAPDQSCVAAVRSRPTVCLLPGSRRSELEANLGPYLEIARRLHADRPELRFVLPHVDARREGAIRARLAAAGADFIEFHLGPLDAWLAGALAVLAKSGTGSLEACLLGAPTVVVYQVHGAFAHFLYRNFLSVPWIASANLIAGRPVVPELVFHDRSGWRSAEAALRSLLDDGPARAACLEGLADVRRRLGDAGASVRVAGWIQRFLAGNPA